MGKFDGVLLLSDFDNTLVYTEDALLSGGKLPPLNSANRKAIHYFMAEGGIFSVATGRALPSFPHCPQTAHERADHPFQWSRPL